MEILLAILQLLLLVLSSVLAGYLFAKRQFLKRFERIIKRNRFLIDSMEDPDQTPVIGGRLQVTEEVLNIL